MGTRVGGDALRSRARVVLFPAFPTAGHPVVLWLLIGVAHRRFSLGAWWLCGPRRGQGAAHVMLRGRAEFVLFGAGILHLSLWQKIFDNEGWVPTVSGRETAEMYSSQSWRLRRPRLWHRQSLCLMRTHVLVCSWWHVGRELCGVSLRRTLIPLLRAPPS